MTEYYADFTDNNVVLPELVSLFLEVAYRKPPPGDPAMASLSQYMLWKLNMEPGTPAITLRPTPSLLAWMTSPCDDSDNIALPRMARAAVMSVGYLARQADVCTRTGRLWLLGWYYFNFARLSFDDYVPNQLREMLTVPGTYEELPLIMEAVWNFRKRRQDKFPLDAPEQRIQYREHCLRWEQSLFPPEHYGLPSFNESQAKQAPCTTHTHAPEIIKRDNGVNILGWINAMSGIGEDARTVSRALHACKTNCALVDVSGYLPHNGHTIDVPLKAEKHPVFKASIICLAAQESFKLYHRTPTQWWEGSVTIGLCPWELPDWPDRARPALEFYDELWAPSSFVAQAFKNKGVLVHYVPHAILPIESRGNLRTEMGIADDIRVFLTIFDSASSMERKNPEAVIRAFNRAFANTKDNVLLIVKAINSHRFAERWAKLRTMDKTGGRVIFLDEAFSRERLTALLDTCDVFVSLHRSEGFGRLLAEVMTLGKILICSDFGGVTDFANSKTALLVDGRTVPLKPGSYLFAEGQHWYDADADDAARQMRRCLNPSSRLLELAKNGKMHILEKHSPQTVGATIRSRLERLGVLQERQ